MMVVATGALLGLVLLPSGTPGPGCCAGSPTSFRGLRNRQAARGGSPGKGLPLLCTVRDGTGGPDVQPYSTITMKHHPLSLGLWGLTRWGPSLAVGIGLLS